MVNHGANFSLELTIFSLNSMSEFDKNVVVYCNRE